MTKISAQVIADSKNEFGNRITTMVVTFPRFILAELNTHRMFSRNSASSRAIPFKKMVKSVEENPFIPMAYQVNHKAMQGTEYFNKEQQEMLDRVWLEGRNDAVKRAKNLAFGIGFSKDGKEFSNIEVTKQLCNRLLEPFMWHTVIITSTEWENFFALRCPIYEVNNKTFRSWKDAVYDCSINARNFTQEDLVKANQATILERLAKNKGQAEIHMMALAEAMWDAYNESTPKELKAGEWHIPFGDNIDIRKVANLIPHYQKEDGSIELSSEVYDAFIKIATARCARVSYTVVGEESKEPNYENDIKLHDNLAKSGHASPFEHIAQAMEGEGRSRNFLGGWKQYREIMNL